MHSFTLRVNDVEVATSGDTVDLGILLIASTQDVTITVAAEDGSAQLFLTSYAVSGYGDLVELPDSITIPLESPDGDEFDPGVEADFVVRLRTSRSRPRNKTVTFTITQKRYNGAAFVEPQTQTVTLTFQVKCCE